MAFARQSFQLQEENMAGLGENKAGLLKGSQGLAVQAGKRRALADIGNSNAATYATRSQTAKDKAGLEKPAVGGDLKEASKPRLTRTNPKSVTKDVENVVRPSGLVPRTRSAARKQGGMSMSHLLQSRSEQAVSAKKSPCPPSPLPDIDSCDSHNPLAASEYANDIYSYYRRAEPKYQVSPDYMASQTDINEKMRAILIDWLVEVHLKFKLMPETLFLTCNLIDRYLATQEVTRKNLQLVGVTAMLIASKYEEIWAPEVRDFVYISDKAYARDQILDMEKKMLNTLSFNLTIPTTYNFLARFLKAAGCALDKNVNMLAGYIVEVALVEFSMLKYSYSMIAAAGSYVALSAYSRPDPYPKALARHSSYSLEEVLPCARDLVKMMQKAPTSSLNAVYKKYSSGKFLEIAKVEPPTSILMMEAESPM